MAVLRKIIVLTTVVLKKKKKKIGKTKHDTPLLQRPVPVVPRDSFGGRRGRSSLITEELLPTCRR